MRIGTVSRLRFCKRSWGFKNHFRWNIVYFRKPRVRSNQLDVWETNFGFAQFNRIRHHFFGCRIKDGWKTPHLISGIWSSQFFTGARTRMIKFGETRRNLQRERKFMESLMIFTMLILFPQTWILFVRKLCCTSFKTTKQWPRWPSREEAYNETCFRNLQSCTWLVVWQNQFGLQDPHQLHWHQKTNSPTCFVPRSLQNFAFAFAQ